MLLPLQFWHLPLYGYSSSFREDCAQNNCFKKVNALVLLTPFGLNHKVRPLLAYAH